MMGTFGMAGSSDDSLSRSIMSSDAARAKSKAISLKAQFRLMSANLAKMMMINEALWELIGDQHGLTEQDLHEKLYDIDMRDGQLDGKNQRKPIECPDCGRMVSARHPACIYCGQIIDDSVFKLE